MDSPRNGGRLQHFGVKSLLAEAEASCEAMGLLSTVRFVHATWVVQKPRGPNGTGARRAIRPIELALDSFDDGNLEGTSIGNAQLSTSMIAGFSRRVR